MNVTADRERILVTGSTGLLGSALLKELATTYDVVSFCGDVADQIVAEKYIKDPVRYNWVIHTAAITNVDACERDRRRSYEVNVTGTRNVRDIAQAHGAALAYISTASVFSGGEGNYKEEDLPYPINFYNFTKTVGEECVAEYTGSVILRVNILGIHPRGSRGRNFLEWLVDSLREQKAITLFTDVMVNPLSSSTLAEIIGELLVVEQRAPVYHLGSSTSLSKAEIGKIVISYLPGSGENVRFAASDSAPGHAARPKDMTLGCRRIESALNKKMPELEREVHLIMERYVSTLPI